MPQREPPHGRAIRVAAGKATHLSSRPRISAPTRSGTTSSPGLILTGAFYTDALRVVEHWTPVDANTIDYEATIEDPNVFTQPWKVAFRIVRNRQENFEFFEVACWEGVTLSNLLDTGRAAVREGRLGIHTHQEP